MSTNDPQLEEILPLVDKMIDGVITPDELQRLESALDCNAELQREVFAYHQVHANLYSDIRSKQVLDSFIADELGMPAEAAAVRMPALDAALAAGTGAALEGDLKGRSGSTGRKSGLWKSLVGFGIGAAVAVVAMLYGMQRPADKGATIATPVAYLTTSTGCAWGNNAARFQSLGAGVGLGDEIALQEGIAEFRTASGVYISVEGPADFVLTSADSLVLQYGKVTAQVPLTVRGFRVMAGGCRLTTSEAEFGVISTGARIDTHVFAGEVVATNALVLGQSDSTEDDALGAPALSNQAFLTATIDEGHSLTLSTRDGIMKAIRRRRADPTFFATKLNMAGPLPVTQAYVDAVLASKPKDYWRFESAQEGLVSSEVPGDSLSMFGGVRLTELDGNRVAEFPPGGDCYLFSRKSFDESPNKEYSFEVWVKPSHVHFGTVLGLCPSEPVTKLANSFLLEVQGSTQQPGRSNFGHPNSIRFLHRDPPARSAELGTNCFSLDPYAVRRWQHVVAVKRGDQLELYVDGKLEGQVEEKSTLAGGQRLIVGRQALSVDNNLQFIGQLDEVAVYTRALSPKEIEAHYKLIEWTQVKKPFS